MEINELKSLLEQQGSALEAFKTTLENEMKGKLNKDDPILKEKLAKIEKSLDDAVEAKAKIDAEIAAEKKEREELEKKLNRITVNGAGSEAEAKKLVELSEFNAALSGLAAERKKQFSPLDFAGMDAYKAAQNHYLREGKDNLTADEVKTLSVGSDPDGGYWVTPDLGGRIVSKVYETSPVRQYASVQAITTDALEGIEDNGEAGAGYAGEQSTSGDATTPQIGKWRIPVYWIDTEPKTTQQVLDDPAVNVEAWLAAKVADKMGRFENAEFVTGSTGRIYGFLGAGYTFSADSGSGVPWGRIGYLGTGTSGDFPSSNPADKLIDLVGLLKNAYLANARWITRRSVITKIRKFKDSTTGQYLWVPSFVAGQPETILGYPVARMEDVPELASGSISLAFGDLQQAYQIVDRQGIRVLRDPYTAKPYVKFYTTKRTGGGVVNFEAIKVMKFS
jgi:HK97 family phage major capsid protein